MRTGKQSELKKILYVSPNGFTGGAEKIVHEMVTLHRDFLHQEVGVLFFNGGTCSESLSNSGFRVFSTPAFRLSRLPSFLRALRMIRSLVKQEQIGIIHSTMAYGHLVMSLATLGLPVKRVWFQHGPVTGHLDWLASLLPVDEIIFNSEFMKKLHFQKNPDLYHPRTLVLPLGIRSGETPARLPKKTVNVLMVGRTSPSKGYHLILDFLIEERAKNWLSDFHFTLVGVANTDTEKTYQRELLKQGQRVSDVFTFVDGSGDLKTFYRRSDVLIQPSLIGEGFGLVLAEAMSYGLLVIGPSYGGCAEILKDGVTGFALDFHSQTWKESLKHILQSFSHSPSNFVSLREEGHRLIGESYTPERMIVNLNAMYLSL